MSKQGPKPNFSMDELLRLLEDKAQKDGEGMTQDEMVEAVGMSRSWVGARVRDWILSGVLEFAGWRRGQRVDDASCRTPVYRLKA